MAGAQDRRALCFGFHQIVVRRPLDLALQYAPSSKVFSKSVSLDTIKRHVMTHFTPSHVWKRLRLNGIHFIGREELEKLAGDAGLDANASVAYLLKQGYLERISRGFFYVPTLDEIKLGGWECSSREFIAKSIEHRGTSNWYFGLQSALKLNLMTHEHFNMEFIISDTVRTTKAVEVMATPVRFYRWSSKLFIPGSIKQKFSPHGILIQYSDPEKTVLDLCYWRYTNRMRDIDGPLREYGEQCDQNKLRSYLSRFPPQFRGLICNAERTLAPLSREKARVGT